MTVGEDVLRYLAGSQQGIMRSNPHWNISMMVMPSGRASVVIETGVKIYSGVGDNVHRAFDDAYLKIKDERLVDILPDGDNMRVGHTMTIPLTKGVKTKLFEETGGEERAPADISDEQMIKGAGQIGPYRDAPE